MNKTLLLLLTLTTLIFNKISAQDKISAHDLAVNLANKIISKQNQQKEKQTRIIKQRLILDSSFYLNPSTNNLSLKRTQSYNYSGTRGSSQVPFSNSTYIFVSNSNQRKYTTTDYDSSKKLVNNSLGANNYNFFGTYDTDNNPITNTFFQFNTVNSTWEIYTHVTYEYSNNYPTLVQSWANNVSTGNPLDKTNYIYNSSNQLIQILETSYDGVSAYYNTHNYLFTYSGQNLLTFKHQIWDTSNNTWVNSSMRINTFNSNNLITTENFYSTWDTTSNTYTEEAKTENSYDNQNRLDSIVYYNGFPNLSLTSSRKLFYNGNSKNFSKVRFYDAQSVSNFESNITFDANENMTHENTKYKSTGSSNYDSLVFYANYYYENYNNGVSSIQNNTINQLNVFPNPSHDHFYLSYQSNYDSKIYLVNTLGQMQYTTIEKSTFNGSHLIKINTENLACGIYFLNIENNIGEHKSIKVIKE